MRTVYKTFALLTALGVAAQAAAMALAVFTIIDMVEGGGVLDSSYDPMDNNGSLLHWYGAMVVAALGLILLIVSFFNRFPGAKKWAAITFALVVLQWVLAFTAYEVPAVGYIHGLNALAIFTSALLAYRAARRADLLAATVPARAPAAL
jgi:heme A synthase